MKTILCYGDSNTYGFDGTLMPVTGEGRRFDENTRWTCLLGKLLGEGYCVISEGLNGRTTVFDDPEEYGRNGLSTLDPIFRSQQPVDLVTVMLGTNDLKDMFSASADVISNGMRRIIVRLQQLIAESANPGAKILLMAPANVACGADGIYRYDLSAASVVKGARLAEKYRALAEQYGCEFADVGSWVKVDPSDGTHLSAESHRIIAEKLAETVKAVIG